MPFISVEILEGRTREQRSEFAESVTQAAVKSLGAQRDQVRIRFIELHPDDLARGGVLISDNTAARTTTSGENS
ncbi:tautomerase family protein [Mycobacterium sp. NPDC003449]